MKVDSLSFLSWSRYGRGVGEQRRGRAPRVMKLFLAIPGHIVTILFGSKVPNSGHGHVAVAHDFHSIADLRPFLVEFQIWST